MSLKDAYARADETRTADGGSIRNFPRFDLEYEPDCIDDPTHIAIFPRYCDPFRRTERWVSADRGSFVPLEACR